MSAARLPLSNDSLSLSEISECLGFSSQEYTPHSGSVFDSVTTFSLGGFTPSNGFLPWSSQS